MAKFVVMEVYSVDADSAETAKAEVEGSTSHNDSCVLVAEQLGGLVNPYHWEDAQNKFGNIKPAVVEEEAPTTVE
jgi:hypothetical protein